MTCTAYPPPIPCITVTESPAFPNPSWMNTNTWIKMRRSKKRENLLRRKRNLKNKLWTVTEMEYLNLTAKRARVKLEKTRITWKLITFFCCWAKKIKRVESIISHAVFKCFHLFAQIWFVDIQAIPIYLIFGTCWKWYITYCWMKNSF